MKTYHIYRLINTADGGKSYIGLTGQKNPEARFNKSQYRGKAIRAAIEKFGWQSFTHEILAKTTHIAVANKLEQDFIEKFDTTNPEHGYNIQKGGSYCRRGIHRSKSTSRKQSRTMSSKKWYHNPTTNETIRLLPNEPVPAGFVLGRGNWQPSNPFGIYN